MMTRRLQAADEHWNILAISIRSCPRKLCPEKVQNLELLNFDRRSSLQGRSLTFQASCRVGLDSMVKKVFSPQSPAVSKVVITCLPADLLQFWVSTSVLPLIAHYRERAD